MLDPVETLWSELKAYAAKYARSDRPLPLDEECDEWLRSTLKRCEFDLPPDAFEFYSSELCTLIEEYRKKAMSEEGTTIV